MINAAELVAAGGPSAPVWAFFTAISLGIIGLIAQQLAAKKAANEAKIEASKSAESAATAAANTSNISNGFAGKVDRKLDRIIREQDSLSNAFREHLEWHLNNSKEKS